MKLKEIRVKQGISQRELARRLGTTPQNISQYESGKRKPKLPTLNKIAAALGVSATDLLDTEERRDYFLTIPQVDLFEGIELYKDEIVSDYLAQYMDHLAHNATSNTGSDNALSPSDQAALNHFRPLSQDNKNKALDYMDYLKERQDKE